MARQYFITKTQTNEMMGKLDLSVTSDLSRVINNYTSASFTLKIDRKTPKNWEELVEPELMSVWVVDSFFKEPLWAGKIIDAGREKIDEVTLDCISFEGGFTQRKMRDCTYNKMDPMVTFRKIVEDNCEFMDSDPDKPELGTWFTGIGLEYDIETSDLERSIEYKKYNRATILDTLNDWATSNQIEWTIDPRFVDPVNRVGFKKVLVARHKYLGTVTDTPNHQFILNAVQNKQRVGGGGGNITGFRYSRATNGDKYATYFTALGDGSGDLQTISRPIRNSEREKKGYPRVEADKSFSGVTWTEDIQQLGEEESKKLFSLQDIITLDAHDNGATNLQSMQLGDSVVVRLKAPSLDQKRILRLVGWSVGNESFTFSPTLAELGTDPYKFKAAVDPLSEDDSSSDAGTNPNENGVWVPDGDGGAWTIDPENGFGNVDSNGDWNSAMDGGGTSGTITRYKVKTYDALAKTAVLIDLEDFDGTSTEVKAINSSGTNLFPGDYVATGVDTVEHGPDKEEWAVIVSNERVRYNEPVPFTKWRVFDRYPVNVASFKIGIGSSFVDTNNVFGKGKDCVIIDNIRSVGSTNYNFYNPVTGQAGNITPPSGYIEAPYPTQIWGGVAFRTFLDSNNRPRVFKKNNSVVGGWELMPGLPTNPSLYMPGGSWSKNSSTDEIFTRPTIVSGRISGSAYVQFPWAIPNTYVGVQMEFTVYQLSSSMNSMTPVHTYNALMPVPAQYVKVGDPVPTQSQIEISTYSNGPHVYIEAQLFGIVPGNGLSDTRLFYTNLDDASMEFHDLRRVNTYLGGDCTPRVSKDGLMYGAYIDNAGGAYPEVILSTRGITDTEATTTSLGNGDIIPVLMKDNIYVVRDEEFDRYFVIANLYSNTEFADNGTIIWEAYPYSGSVSPQLPLQSESSAGVVTRPNQNPDGTIIFNLRRSSTSHELHRINPKDVWTEFGTPADTNDPNDPSTDPTL